MDCEKFESHLIDELYDELDEVTSAATKRHVAGCARCASLLSGMKATKRVAVLPLVDPPADLEDRILTAAKEAQKVVPIRGRVSRAISWAGSWAMRPQTAMAALFLIMIGTSTLLLKGKKAGPPSSAVSVQDEGSPAAVAAAPSVARPMDLPTAADDGKQLAAPAPSAAPAATATAYAMEEPSSPAEARRAASAPPPPPSKRAPSDTETASGLSDLMNASPVAGAGGAAKKEGYGAGSIGGGGAYAQAPASPPAAQAANAPPMPPGQAAAGPKALAKDDNAPLSDYDLAMSAFNAGDYANARSQFDTLAATSGQLDAALMAGRSEEMLNGCTSEAVRRYDDVARRGPATRAGYQALFAAGHCLRIMGDNARARDRLTPLLTVPALMAQAQQELALINTSKGGGVVGHAARAAPAPAPKAAAKPQAPPSATAVDQSY